MNRRNDNQVVLLGDILNERNNLERGSRVETGCGLVEEKELRAGDQLRSDTDTTLLTTRDALSDRCSDQVVSLTLETESGQERLDALDALKLADMLRKRKAGCEVQRLTDSERADERIFLLDVCRYAAEGLWVGR